MLMQGLDSRRRQPNWSFEVKGVNPAVGSSSTAAAAAGHKQRSSRKVTAGTTQRSNDAQVPGTTDVLPVTEAGLQVSDWPLLCVWPCDPVSGANAAALQRSWVTPQPQGASGSAPQQ